MKRRLLWIVGVAILLSAGCRREQAAQSGAQPMDTSVTETGQASTGNRLPEVADLRIEPANPAPGQMVRAAVKVWDPDGDPLLIRYHWRLQGQRIGTEEGHLSLVGAKRGETVEVRVVVSDGKGGDVVDEATAQLENQAPLLHSVVLEPLGAMMAGQAVSARPRAVDPDGDALEYHFRWWVNGELQSENGGTLSPETFRRGDQIEVEVIATDGVSQSTAIRSPPLTIANAIPRFLSQPSGLNAEGEFVYQIEADDPDGDKRLRYALIQSPPGMRIDPVLGLVRWKPEREQAGRFPVKIAVDDLQGGTAIQEFEVIVAGAEG